MEYIPMVFLSLFALGAGFCLGKAFNSAKEYNRIVCLQEDIQSLKKDNKIINDLYNKERHLKEKYQDMYYDLSNDK